MDFGGNGENFFTDHHKFTMSLKSSSPLKTLNGRRSTNDNDKRKKIEAIKIGWPGLTNFYINEKLRIFKNQ